MKISKEDVWVAHDVKGVRFMLIDSYDGRLPWVCIMHHVPYGLVVVSSKWSHRIQALQDSGDLLKDKVAEYERQASA